LKDKDTALKRSELRKEAEEKEEEETKEKILLPLPPSPLLFPPLFHRALLPLTSLYSLLILHSLLLVYPSASVFSLCLCLFFFIVRAPPLPSQTVTLTFQLLATLYSSYVLTTVKYGRRPSKRRLDSAYRLN